MYIDLKYREKRGRTRDILKRVVAHRFSAPVNSVRYYRKES